MTPEFFSTETQRILAVLCTTVMQCKNWELLRCLWDSQANRPLRLKKLTVDRASSHLERNILKKVEMYIYFPTLPILHLLRQS